jgi:hypothetical protein
MLRTMALIIAVIKQVNFHFFDPIEHSELFNLTAINLPKMKKELLLTLFYKSEYLIEGKRAGHPSLYCLV